uniref:Uncharacterized protein n=1 Tax=viral metagenome TaxID=1070528 RepID=A0A6C0EVH1_9ZZZZ
MYLYDNLQKIITLDRYNEQKGPPHITAINYAGQQQNNQHKRFTLLSEYFYKPPRVLAINDKIKRIATGCIDIADPGNNNNDVHFFLKISLFLGMTTASYYFLYFYKYKR